MNTHPGFFESLTSSALLAALWTTIWLSFGAQLIGVIIGLVMGPLRVSRFGLLRGVSGAYVWFFRGSPELLQILAWYSVLPLVGVNLGVVAVGLLGLGVNEGARMTEIVRGAIASVDVGQTDAAKVLGMGQLRTNWSVILPQAARLIVPPLGNQMNYMFKTTSLVSFIGIVEMLRETDLAAQFTNAPLPIYLATATLYLAITTVWGVIQSFFERRVGADTSLMTRQPQASRFSVGQLVDLPGRYL